ncbi:MAG TPA: M20/M25/M40 family metallo-hydrolase [Terriglobales bacterium]|nr:M20/M25/M40 family metallo-hydrolase [Terriglobales bacterium]
MFKRTAVTGVLLCAALVTAAQAQSDVERVRDEALKPSALGENLRRLTDEIGGRVPGTPAMDQAIQWAVDAFRATGADSVHREDFSMPVAWSEGATQVEVVAPVRFRVRAVSMAWSPPTRGVVRARVVDVGQGSPAELAKATDVRGALLLVRSEPMRTWADLFGEYLRAPAIVETAVRGGAAGIAYISTREHDLLYRHINISDGNVDRLPMVQLAREDGLRIARLLEAGKKVEVEFSLPNRVGPGFTTANVVAEIRGREQPQEFVVLGAHLDSWDLGTGALDNGCNAALVVDVLRAIKASGVRPRRSIRFILFSGEEQGLLGSKAYAAAHRAELDNAVAAVIFDTGIGEVTGFSLGGRKDVVAAAERMVAPFREWDAATLTTDAFVGTDNFDFLLEGVPTLVANQKEANYLVNYHASSDTFDKVDLDRLKKHVAIAAGVTFAIADAEERVGPRQSRAEVEQLLRESGLEQQMKTFGLWADWEAKRRGRQ